MSRSRESSPASRGRESLSPHTLALLLALGWLLLLGWQVAASLGERRLLSESLEQRGRASIGMLEASLRAVGRGRRERPELLTSVFQEISGVPGILGVWLTELDGELIASGSPARDLPDPRGFPGVAWEPDGLLIGEEIDIGPCQFGPGRGVRFPSLSESRPVHVFLLLDRGELDREITADLVLRGAVLAVSAMAAVVAWLLLRARRRARSLSIDLALVEERSRRDREWALLGAGLAHETKNPLNVIRSAAQRLGSEEPIRPADASLFRQIVDEVDRVVARINEFLRFSRPVEPRPERLDLAPFLAGLRQLVEPDLAPRRGSLVVECAPVAAIADADVLRQVILNLLVNASRAIGEGGAIWVVAEQRPDGRLGIEVRDDGEGIAREELEKVFEPYYTRSPGGTGLGLAIVRRLAEAHGWRVEIESHPGAGTRVRVTGIEIAQDGNPGQVDSDRRG